MKCLIRPMKESEYPLLEDFLYEAVFLQEGEKKPPRSITRLPALYAYVRDFGIKRRKARSLLLCGSGRPRRGSGVGAPHAGLRLCG